MTTNSATPPRSRRSPRDFIALSRRLLQLSGQGAPRVAFLRDLSRMLLEFAECDRLEIRVRGELDYRWHATLFPTEACDIEYTPAGVAASQRGAAPRPADLGRFVAGELGDRLEPSLPCFTPHGSFWTADLPVTAARHGSPTSPGLRPETRSLAVIPFAIGSRDLGLLQLEAARPGLFDQESTEFYEAVAETLGLAIADRRVQIALRERIKELGCLYGIAHTVAEQGAALDEALRRVVTLLPPAWQYPDLAQARIVLDDRVFTTERFEAVQVRQTADIVVRGRRRGQVAVGYLAEVRDAPHGSFLPEEAHLIEAVALEITQFVERQETEAQGRRLEAQLRHAERLSTVGQLAAGIAHEINEPLGSILGFAQLARKDQSLREATAHDLDRIIAASLHAREIVTKLMLFARQAPTRKASVSLEQVADYALSLIEHQCAQGGIRIVRRVAPQLPPLLADHVQLAQVLVNLLVNAMQAMPRGGTLTVDLGREEDVLTVGVADTGEGMTAEVQRKIFTPFFTTKAVGRGTGLGLSVVHGIVTSHGGTIECESRVGQGTRFTVRLPLTATSGSDVAGEETP